MPKQLSSFCKFKSLACLACWLISIQANQLMAKDSIWYKSNDPLNTKALTSPPIPVGYLDSQYDGNCAASNYANTFTLYDVA